MREAVAGRIRDESIAEVRAATDIVALVGEYVALRPAGGTRMKGLCPFHQEKTPSFTVDSTRAHYHCFGCSEGGDAIDFLQKQERRSSSTTGRCWSPRTPGPPATTSAPAGSTAPPPSGSGSAGRRHRPGRRWSTTCEARASGPRS